MENLKEQFRAQLDQVDSGFIRYLHDQIEWDARLIALLGARGVGKTTLLLQHIRMNNNIDDTLFVSADDLYFTQHTLVELATTFYKNGGKHLYIDEIHRYKNWSKEVKNIYDQLPQLQVVYTGSSILDLEKGGSDLSRRKLQYYLYGLSFREYLAMAEGLELPVHSLESILNNRIDFPYRTHRPIQLFKEYLRSGYYPFFKEKAYLIRLSNVILQTLEVDIPQFANMNVGTTHKLRTLLYIIAQSVPFKPNFSKLARDLDISRNDVKDLIFYLEKAGLLSQLRSDTGGIMLLGKTEKIYLDNTNLAYAISSDTPDLGNLHETAFFMLTRVTQDVKSSTVSDFTIGDYTFEVGGKAKSRKQIKNVENSYIVKDDIEYGSNGTIPLWTLGLGY